MPPASPEASLEEIVKERDALRLRLHTYESMLQTGQLIGLDYPVRPRVRYGHGRPLHDGLLAVIAPHEVRYRNWMAVFLQYAPELSRIASRTDSLNDPCWANDWIPALDAVGIYGFLASRNPKTYLEIGSGMSTKFARRAIRDHDLRTRIVSVDPSPRSGVDTLCDEVIRQPLEAVDQSLFASLGNEDMMFYDGSHVSFQNSDATVFFTEILPGTAQGVLIGVHDIFLPHDYPPGWLTRYYNEQYLLACYLLAGDSLRIEFPAYYCSHRPELLRMLDPLWTSSALAGAERAGGAFWFTTQFRRA